MTHSPPASVIRKMEYRNLPEDTTNGLVEWLWVELGRPSLLCGHMHQRGTDTAMSSCWLIWTLKY